MEFSNFNSKAKSLFASKVNDSATILSAVKNVLAAENADEEVPQGRESKLLQEFLEVPFGDAKELAVKKLCTTAIVVAKEKGVLPFKIDADPQRIAMLVDDGMSRMKVAYQKETGKISVKKATDILVDVAATHVIAIADRVVERGTRIAVNALSKAMLLNPHTTALAPFAKAASPFLAKQAKEYVHKGLTSMVNSSKPIIRNVMEKVSNAIANTERVVKRAFVKLFS